MGSQAPGGDTQWITHERVFQWQEKVRLSVPHPHVARAQGLWVSGTEACGHTGALT